MSEGRAWFYLTLWRGTPPEFTDKLDAEIADSDSAIAFLQTADNIESKIKKNDSFMVNISEQESFNTEIIKGVEVVWYVG